MNITLSYGEVEIKKAKAKVFFVNFGNLLKLLGELDLAQFRGKDLSEDEIGARAISLLLTKISALTDNYDEVVEILKNLLGGEVKVDDLEVEDILLMIRGVFGLYGAQEIISLVMAQDKKK